MGAHRRGLNVQEVPALPARTSRSHHHRCRPFHLITGRLGFPSSKPTILPPTPYPCPTPSCWLASLRASLAHGLLFAQSHKETLLPQTQSIHIRCACECVREEGMAGVLALTTSRHPVKKIIPEQDKGSGVVWVE